MRTSQEAYEERQALLREIKRAVIAAEGSVNVAAAMLGMRPSALSQRLNHKGLVEWWAPYRSRLSLERYRARNRRAQDKYRRRLLMEQGIDPDSVPFRPRKPRYV